MRVVECIPNFSEGRRPNVITAIVEAIATADVNVLDVSSDEDHNRTVVTFVGEPSAVVVAALNGTRVAADLIDMTHHEGVHPRIGATDVIPLVPLRNVPMVECIALARELGQRIGAELNLPVYLYEQAALHQARRNLADVRAGQYEGLADRIADDPPDYGPAEVGTAGAVSVGARGPLIAFNAYLDTDDIDIAKDIARRVRTSGGGLPNLKAMGVLVDGRAQVSMNVIDYRKTPLHEIIEAVRQGAESHGARVTETEVVGLVPQAALIEAALAYLGLPANTADHTLEKRLGSALDDYREIVFE